MTQARSTVGMRVQCRTIDRLGCERMEPSDPGPPDPPPPKQSQDDPSREGFVIRPLSKEQREAAVRRLQHLHDKTTSREAAEEEIQPGRRPEDASVGSTMPVSEGDRLMLDPSFLLSEDGAGWLREEPRRVRGGGCDLLDVHGLAPLR